MNFDSDRNSLLQLCMLCHSVRGVDAVWRRLQERPPAPAGTVYSHGLCTGCKADAMQDLAALASSQAPAFTI